MSRPGQEPDKKPEDPLEHFLQQVSKGMENAHKLDELRLEKILGLQEALNRQNKINDKLLKELGEAEKRYGATITCLKADIMRLNAINAARSTENRGLREQILAQRRTIHSAHDKTRVANFFTPTPPTTVQRRTVNGTSIPANSYHPLPTLAARHRLTLYAANAQQVRSRVVKPGTQNSRFPHK